MCRQGRFEPVARIVVAVTRSLVDIPPPMRCRFRHPLLPVAGLVALVVAGPLRADPQAELASFSVFKTVNLEKLASGTVMSSRGVAMSGPRDLALESCYVV